MDPLVAAESAAKAEKLDPIQLMLHASGVIWVVLALLVLAATAVWVIWLLKTQQLRRLQNAEDRFEREAEAATDGASLVTLASRHRDAPGARVVLEIAKRHGQANASSELLLAVAKRAIADESQRASTLMALLSSIASASPFIGLFGTVWGIMDAFLKIGVEKSASLPVVAPAIGEALIATAFGLVAAIPASIGYNFVDKRIGDLLEVLSASSETWAELMAADSGGVAHGRTTREAAPQFPHPSHSRA